MRGRWWLVILIAVIGVGLGVAIAGVPSRGKDRPLSIRAQSPAATTTTTTETPATTTPPTRTGPQPATRPPGEVRVRAANASGTDLAATHMTTRLANLGYQTLPPLDTKRTDLAGTEVVFSPGFDPEARALAQTLGASQVVSDDPSLTCTPQPCTGDIVVFVGRDLAT